jgi:hypothetical protein
MQQLKQAEITFPCAHTISENPEGFCREIANVRQLFDKGIEEQIIAEMKRLRKVDPKSVTLTYLAVQLQQLFPAKYRTNDFISAKQSVTVANKKRKNHRPFVVVALILIFLTVIITLAIAL